MLDPGSAISISLEDVETRIRAIAARRTALPPAAAVGQTEGPSSGASREYAASLRASAQVLELFTEKLGAQLGDLDHALSATGHDLVAADESVADDVRVLNGLADSVTLPKTPGRSSAPAGSGSRPGQPAPAAPPAGTSDGDAAETLG